MIEFKQGEVLVEEVRRHWFVMFGPVLASIFLAFLPPIIISVLFALSFDVFLYLSFDGHPFASSTLLYLLWLLLIIAFLAVKWTLYYLDVWYITNYRIVNIEQSGLFMRKAKTLSLDRVQDVTVEVKGIIPTMMDFGTIHVQSAGASRIIDLNHSRHPYKIKKVILKAIEERRSQRLESF